LWIKVDENNRIFVEGELSEENAVEFEADFRALPLESAGTIILDMSAFDIADGIGIATAINMLRYLLERGEKLIIIAAPQLLAHNLYRVGMLEANSRIALLAMREEEPYG